MLTTLADFSRLVRLEDKSFPLQNLGADHLPQIESLCTGTIRMEKGFTWANQLITIKGTRH